jgi:hypothetical protein
MLGAGPARDLWLPQNDAASWDSGSASEQFKTHFLMYGLNLEFYFCSDSIFSQVLTYQHQFRDC